MNDFSHVTFISAGAGSGKTYRLTEDLERALTEGRVNPAAVIGTTFTVKAAAELKDRVRERLIARGRVALAEQTAQALIGTVHSVCERLLKRFAFELGLSPELNVMSVEDGQRFFNQALDDVLDIRRVREMNAVAARLSLPYWQSVVKDVADKARENDLDADALAAMGKSNADEFLAFFDPPAEGGASGDISCDLKCKLIEAVNDALTGIDRTTDTTVTTAKYVKRLREATYQLGRASCPWSVWMGLSTAKAAKSSEPAAAAVRAAATYAANPALHADIRTYIQGVFDIAALALNRFQLNKTDIGLIDFNDMEQLTLRALDVDTIRERLNDEVELLLVDEFQDTNPMQLALFIKLACLADRVIFVGDVKQAIYEFRGCDSQLVFQTLEGLAAAAADTAKLQKNWRSRPALVHYVNEVFAEAFAGQIPRHHVTLEPVRDEALIAPAVVKWTLAGSRKAQRCQALAGGIAELVQSGYRVVDPDTHRPRAVQYGDIAVLARTNPNVEDIARTLRQQNVPMKMTLKGLLSVAEVGLARACLRRLNDDTDTLATAEIVALADGAEPETWLADRLTWLAGGNASYLWGEADHPIVQRLQALRAGTAMRSPVEVVARVLNDVGIRAIVTGWGQDVTKAAQRQRNLDAFLDLVVTYENHCDSQHDAATLTGFLFWLENPSSPELDLQPVITTGNAVHVLTYHRAKGLEWPVVIATDFDYEERSNLWDARVSLTERFDVNAPLANRTVRLWPNVFGRKTRGVPVLDAINASGEGALCAQKSISEQCRLAYVGITRARDLVVVALPAGNAKSGSWMQSFCTTFALPDGGRLELPNGVAIPSGTRDYAADDSAPAPLVFAPRWFERRERRDDFVRERLSPSSAPPIETATVAEIVEFGERIALHGDDMLIIGNGLHAVIAAEIVNPGQRDALDRARAIFRAHGVASYIGAEDAVSAGRRFLEFVQARFRPKRIYCERPVVTRTDDDRLMAGWIDLVLDTDDGWVIFDHKSSPRPKQEWEAEALEYSGQLSAYRRGLKAAGCQTASTWIHFAVGGAAVRVVVD